MIIYLIRLLRFKNMFAHLSVLVLSVAIGGFTSIQLGQDVNFDLQNYHYQNPYAFLHDRIDRDIATAEIQSYTNPIIDIPGYLAINNLKPRAAAGVLGMIQGLNIWLIFEIMIVLLGKFKARKAYVYLIALFTAIVSFYGAANLSEVGNTMGDNLASIIVLTGLWLVLYSFTLGKGARTSPVKIRLAGYIVMGMAIGLKLTSLIFGIALLVAGILCVGSVKQKIRDSSMHTLALGLGVAISGGYWFMKMHLQFGNPVFPFYNGVFKSDYYPPINFIDSRWLPKNTVDAFLLPYDLMSRQSLSSEIAFKDPRLGVLFTAAVILVAFLIARQLLGKQYSLIGWSRATTALWVFIGVSYVIWLSKFGYYRYALPIELLSLAGIATVIFGVVRKFAVATTIFFVLSIYITSQTVAIDWGRVNWQSTYFGITESNFRQLKNSTVLIAGRAPLGFIVPYLPSSSQTIRVDSDLTSPEAGTASMQRIMINAVRNREQQQSSFYGLVADEDRIKSESVFKSYGYGISTCEVLPIYVREGVPAKIRLCKLNKLG